MQDGPAAGQTVPHVHIHCVPRHFKDLERNDEIYEQIDEAEAQESVLRERCVPHLPRAWTAVGASLGCC